MIERPILFSGPMVRAILEGRKTVTRRQIKPTKAHADGVTLLDHGKGWWPYNAFGDFTSDNEGMEYPIACPYGVTGDRLWVRETWARVGNTDPGYLTYRATYPACLPPGLENVPADLHDAGERWRPSIHMPRAASRILLEVTAVRVERLQAITADQAMAEGIAHADDGLFHVEDSQHLADDPRESFASLWESINGDGSWDANPWVWCVSFRRAEP